MKGRIVPCVQLRVSGILFLRKRVFCLEIIGVMKLSYFIIFHIILLCDEEALRLCCSQNLLQITKVLFGVSF